MIRLGKEVRLLEWGEGTNTLNQIWSEFARGVLQAKAKRKMGSTLITVEVSGSVQKKNPKDQHIKIMQVDEVMTPPAGSMKPKWGEVAMATLKDVKSEGQKTLVNLEIDTAIKIGGTGPG